MNHHFSPSQGDIELHNLPYLSLYMPKRVLTITITPLSRDQHSRRLHFQLGLGALIPSEEDVTNGIQASSLGGSVADKDAELLKR